MKNATLNNPAVLIISGTYPDIKCGVGYYTQRLIENLISRNMNISLLTSQDPLIQKKSYIHPLIRKWNVFSIFRILAFVKNHRPSMINLQVPTAKYKRILSSLILLPLISKIFFRNTPFVVTVHDYSITREVLKIFFVPLFLFSDIILVNNNEDAEDIVKHLPFFKKRLKNIQMGPTIEVCDIPGERKAEFYRKIAYADGDRFISTLGFLKKDRCVDRVIKVFKNIRKNDNRIKLLILGDMQRANDARYRGSVFTLAEKLGVADKVYWLGFCSPEEISFYLSICDLSLLLYERGASFRRSTIINCIVRKIPVLTNINKRYGIDKMLADSGMVIAVDSLNTDVIYKKAKMVLYNDDYAIEMKQRMKSAEKIFNWDRHIEEIVNVYSELMGIAV